MVYGRCVFKVTQVLSVGIFLILRSHHNHYPHDVTPADDVIKMASAEPDSWRVMMSFSERKLLCSLTATVGAVMSSDEGSGIVKEDKNNEDHGRLMKHFIFRNRMKISQDC